MARHGIDDLAELVLDRLAVPHVALGLAVEDRLGELHARNLLARGVDGGQLRHALEQLHRHGGVLHVARHAALGVAGEVEVEVDRRAPLQVAEVDAGLAEALHRHQAYAHARPLDASGVAARAAVAGAPAARAEVGALGAPFAGQRADVAGGNAGFLLGPFGSLGDAVLLAEEVGLPHVEPLGTGGDVVLVVEVFLDPDVGQGHAHGGRGGWLRRDPFAAQELRGVVVVGIDVDDLDARALEPLAAHRALERAVGARGRFRVGRPEHDHLAVLQAVLDRAVVLALADAQAVAPVMRRAPVPAFPAVGVVVHLGVADRIHEAEVG